MSPISFRDISFISVISDFGHVINLGCRLGHIIYFSCGIVVRSFPPDLLLLLMVISLLRYVVNGLCCSSIILLLHVNQT